MVNVEIQSFRPGHAKRFAELNREWLERYDLMEPAEEEQLADPKKYFVDRGGQIFVALHDDHVIGTCAVIPHGVGEVELAKLTVAPEFRGQGIARRLVEHCISWARERGVRRLLLVSNSQLQAALRLYESLGFRYSPLPEDRKYVVADVCMVLSLGSADPAASRAPRDDGAGAGRS
ncbi:MAG: GNAT family N-acetyltransferase [Longimicrobiales bacterium]